MSKDDPILDFVRLCKIVLSKLGSPQSERNLDSSAVKPSVVVSHVATVTGMSFITKVRYRDKFEYLFNLKFREAISLVL